LDLFSPAKINLFLRITKKREDGFHELASLFQTLAFGDNMTISKLPSSATEDSITCNDPAVPCDRSNLVCKAADLFRKKTGSKQHFHIDLAKEVPAGAGLGGGSGNAATMLWAANQLCGLDYSEGDLLEWSGDIGSDISFFFSSGTAYCTGRGEIVRDMPALLDPQYPILLIKPSTPLSTGAVYKALDVNKCSKVNPDELLERFYNEKTPSQDLCINDLELPAFGEMAILQDVKKELIATGEYESVFMSGSGSTMVCLGNHLIQEDTNFERESKDDWLAVLTQPINREDRSKWYEPSFLTDIADLGGIEEEYLIKGADLECHEDHDDDE
jgi:4-diphosphocytidyl-2-C-methyl-D-erythritol kinase